MHDNSTRQTTSSQRPDTTLAEEHAELLRRTEAHAVPILAAVEAGDWPETELGALISFLRTEVLRQVSDVETHLFPHDVAQAPFDQLVADHIQLRTITTELDRAHRQPGDPAVLGDVIERLTGLARRHLAQEVVALSALHGLSVVPSAHADNTGCWPTDDGPVRIDLDQLPETQAVDLAIERLLRLEAGETADVRARHHPYLLDALARWLHEFDRIRFGLTRQSHTLLITCRSS